jgi:hypothetical protein
MENIARFVTVLGGRTLPPNNAWRKRAASAAHNEVGGDR